MTQSANDVVFTSLGMFILDEIHYPDKPSVYDVLGGGGFYALLGSRIALSYNDPKRSAFILDEGLDFPPEVEAIIRLWNTGTIIRRDNSRLTTRGWNQYKDRDLRLFKYVNPKKRIDIEDIQQYPNLINSASFHFICSSNRCATMIEKLETVKHMSLDSPVSPVICWEPIPDSCTPEDLPECQNILAKVDILTPNAEEAALFYNLPEPQTHLELEELAERFVPYLTKDTLHGLGAAVVLRCGPLGMYICSNKGYKKWFPSYHGVNPKPNVIDCTGAGNTACASLTTALILSRNWDIAAIISNVVAGLCIEQLGVPELMGKSQWNGEEFKSRIQNYLEWTLSSYSLDQVLSYLSASG